MELSLKHVSRSLHRPAAAVNSNYLLLNSFRSISTTTLLSKPHHRQFHFHLHATSDAGGGSTPSPAVKIVGKQRKYTNNGLSKHDDEEEPVTSSSDELGDENEDEDEYEDDDEDEDEYEDDDDEEEEEEDDETASVLSLNVKPDRNMALLDEYEMEELDLPLDPNHRSGFVAVLGKPNVGKSTLSNQMVGQKLSIVTDKPQTTRHRILGICSAPEYQIILFDTPGVIEKEMHKLDSLMMKNVQSAAVDADCVLVVVDACKMPKNIDDLLPENMREGKAKVPTLLVLNKRDLIKPGEIAKKIEWYEKNTNVDEVIPVSAKYGQGVADVKDWIVSKIPLGPAYYPKDITSEHPERFFIGEIVREKIFLQYRNEVPYSCQVNVITYKARPGAKDFIQVEIVVEKNSQKIIIIGKNGESLKTLATAARLDIEDFLQKKVYLEVEVKVKEKWRQDEGLLKHYGYDGKIKVFGT